MKGKVIYMINNPYKNEIDIEFQNAVLTMRSQDYYDAIELFSDVLERIQYNKELMDSYAVDLYKYRCMCYRKTNNYSKAITDIDYAIKIASKQNIKFNDIATKNKLAHCLMTKGTIFDQQGDYELAIQNYLDAIPLFSNIYLLLSQNEESTVLLVKAYIGLGTAYYNNSDNTNAKYYFEKCLHMLSGTDDDNI